MSRSHARTTRGAWGGTGITERETEPIEPIGAIPSERMAGTHDLGTRHGRTASHAPDPSRAMLVVALHAVLFDRAHAVVDWWSDG